MLEIFAVAVVTVDVIAAILIGTYLVKIARARKKEVR